MVMSIDSKARDAAAGPSRLMCTVAITVTGLVFCFVLMPQRIRSGDTAFIFHYANILVHILVPILSLVDWCFFDPLFLMKPPKAGRVKRKEPPCFVYIRTSM